MAFFRKPVLDRQRVKELDGFRKNAVKALEELKRSKSALLKELYLRMQQNVERTPIMFYPRKSLKERILMREGRVFASAIKGEHVNLISIFQKAGQHFLVQSNYINMPSEHVFDGSRLTVDGIFTLAHEYAHFPKPDLSAFARANGMGYEQAEELMADILSAKLAVSLGYPKERVLERFAGRELVYGRVPFRKFIWNAVNA